MKDGALRLFGYAVVLNFLSFWAISFVVGDAIQGKIVNGQFYLGNHGTYTEVSHAVFIFSACHACSALVGVLAGTLVGIARNSGKIRNKIVGNGSEVFL